MSIQSEIERIENNIASTYSTLSDFGVDVPSEQNSDNLPNAVAGLDGVFATQAYVDNKIASIPTPDVSGQISAHNVSSTAHSGMFAPAYTYGTTDLTAGTSELETGKLYFVYE